MKQDKALWATIAMTVSIAIVLTAGCSNPFASSLDESDDSAANPRILQPQPVEQHPALAQYPNPAVIGHRGAPGHAPENTIVGFERALELGADVLEMDVWMTSDGELVVIHDATVNRTTDGSGRVADLSWEEIQSLDAGHYFMTGLSEFPYRDQGVGVPSLREVFTHFPDTPIMLDLKPISAEVAVAVAGLVKKFDRADRTVVASFLTRPAEALREHAPEIATGATGREISRFLRLSLFRLTRLYSPPYEALIVPERTRRVHVTSPPLRRAAGRSGLKLFVWTINEPARIQRLLMQGVDGIITDYPDRAREAAQSLGLR